MKEKFKIFLFRSEKNVKLSLQKNFTITKQTNFFSSIFLWQIYIQEKHTKNCNLSNFLNT